MADLPFVNEIVGDPIVMEFSDRGALTKPDQESWLRNVAAPRNSSEIPGMLAIEHKHNGKVIGYVSLVRDLKRVASREAEIGFRLAYAEWGQGYATEAANFMLELAERSISVDRVVAIVDPNNRRCVHVLEKIGMTFESEIMFDHYDYPDHLYVRQRPFL